MQPYLVKDDKSGRGLDTIFKRKKEGAIRR